MLDTSWIGLRTLLMNLRLMHLSEERNNLIEPCSYSSQSKVGLLIENSNVFINHTNFLLSKRKSFYEKVNFKHFFISTVFLR